MQRGRSPFLGYLRDCKLMIQFLMSSPRSQTPAVVLRAEPSEFTRLAYTLAIALACLLAVAAWGYNRIAARDIAAEWRVLDQRAVELKKRALLPGSALACLDAGAIEDSCEKSLFASPQTLALAVTYVRTQLLLLAAAKKLKPGVSDYSDILTGVRDALERDPFSIVAHVVTERPGCRSDQCDLFALLDDVSRVKANLVERRFDSYVKMHLAEWTLADNQATNASPPGGERKP